MIEFVPRVPILAPNKIPDFNTLSYPLKVSKKYDGIRCILGGGELWSRSFKPLPNIQLRKYLADLIEFSKSNEIVCDGELWSPTKTFQEIVSYVMTYDKDLTGSNLRYCLFDAMSVKAWNGDTEAVFNTRSLWLKDVIFEKDTVLVVPQLLVSEPESLQNLLERELEAGGEGLIARSPSGFYKHGRCTMREANIYKIKQFETITVTVIDVRPLTRIMSDALRERDVLGNYKAVNKKAEREVTDELGALVVRTNGGTILRVGSGFDWRGGDKDRVLLWEKQDQLIGRRCDITYLKVGVKDKPRMPVFIRWNDESNSII